MLTEQQMAEERILNELKKGWYLAASKYLLEYLEKYPDKVNNIKFVRMVFMSIEDN